MLGEKGTIPTARVSRVRDLAFRIPVVILALATLTAPALALSVPAAERSPKQRVSRPNLTARP
jgi:hypothetical protein